ncbi:cupin domain-containing protein [Kribbella sp.]|uniref:cupin domain-containing protein n=1 Tax=Kribbella sp. TaxID=1871183 RepID=UPI002D75FF33|nr:cupin domain-containing protein [Kribbella sp.]HZX06183.1 cupin domain-containing protein [Kribbella sp.]
MTTVPEAGPLRDERPALRRCVAGDLDEFADAYWGSRALLSHAPDLPAPYDDLFSLDAVDELLSRRGLRTPFLRIAKNGSVVGDSQFTGPAGAGAEIADQVRDDKVAALFAGGHTVVLQALHRTWPALVDFSTQLAADAGHPVQINAYITPAESQGFAAHYDVHDVFVLQVAGEKHWTVHEPVYVDPLRNQPWTDHARAVEKAARENGPVVDEVLRPGDALYVPRGFLHSAKALGGVSAHLTVGLHTMTRYLLVQELAALAADQASLRTALPLGFDPGDPEQLKQLLPEVIELFTQQLQTTTPDALAERLRRRTWSSNRPAPLAPLAHAAAISSLAIGTTVRLRPGLRCRLIPGDPLVLELPDRTITFPPNTTAAVQQLTSGADCKVGELPALDEPDQLVLVRRLLTEAVLVTDTR